MKRALAGCALALSCAGSTTPPPSSEVVRPSPKQDAPRDPAPPQRVKLPDRADGSGWFCTKNLQIENMSTCTRTLEQCQLVRNSMVQSGVNYMVCLPQPKAACFTFHWILQNKDSFDCSATFASCDRQRAHGIKAMGRDVSEVSECGVAE